MSQRATASFEGLEDRLFMSATVTVAGSTLVVTGTGADDHIGISQKNDVLKVTGLDGTRVTVKQKITSAVKSVKIDLKSGDDLVAILSDITVTNFSYNGGSGDNNFIAAGDIAASGTITVGQSEARAASGTISLLESQAAMATGNIEFDYTDAIGAQAFVTLAGLDATAATGTINVDGILGIAANGNVQIKSNLVAGDTITITDGNAAHTAQVFTAVTATQDTTGIVNPFVIGADKQATANNFAAAVTTANLAGRTDVTVTQVTASSTVELINIPANGAAGNGGLSSAAPVDRVSLRQMEGGKDQAKNGDTVTLNDGQGTIVTFVGRTQASLDAAGQTLDRTVRREFLITVNEADQQGSIDATLLELQTTIDAWKAALPVTQTFYITPVAYVAGDNVLTLNSQVKFAVAPATKDLGAFGNQPITFRAGATAWGTTNMTGGADDFVAGDFITISDGIHAAKTYTAIAAADAIDPAVNFAGWKQQQLDGKFVIGATAAETLQNLADVINYVFNAQVPNAPTTAKFSFVVAEASDNEDGSATLHLSVDSAQLIGEFAGQAINANTTTLLFDNSQQWVNVQQFGRNADGSVNDGTKGINERVASAGDKITLSDGVKTVTFTAVAGTPNAANNEFQVAFTAHQQAVNFAAAVNAAGMTITASPDIDNSQDQNDGDVNLTFTKVGTVGNATVQAPRITILPADATDVPVITIVGQVPNQFQVIDSNFIDATDFNGGADVKQLSAVGDWIVIGDGVNIPVVFTAVGSVPAAGSPNFQVGANLAETRLNLIKAINGYTQSTLNVIAGADPLDNNQITLVNTVAGEAGNFFGIAGQNSNGAGFGEQTAVLSGGANAVNVAAGATITLNDGVTSKTLTAVDASATPTANQFKIGATVAETVTNLVAAINASGLTLLAADQGEGQISVENTVAGIAGNQKIIVADPARYNLDATNMEGGSDGTLCTTKDLSVNNTGYGDNVIELTDVKVGRYLNVSGGAGADTLALSNATITGRTKIALGDGEDVLTITGSTFKSTFSASTGKGDDIIGIDEDSEAGSTFKGSTRFSDSDLMLITDSSVTKYEYKPASNVSVTFSGGANKNSLLNASGTTNGQVSGKAVYNNVNG